MSYIKESRVENSNELIEKNDKITRDWREVFIYAQKIKTSDIHVYQKNNAVIVKMRQSGEMIVTHMYEDRDLINDYFIKLKRISGFRTEVSERDFVDSVGKAGSFFSNTSCASGTTVSFINEAGACGASPASADFTSPSLFPIDTRYSRSSASVIPGLLFRSPSMYSFKFIGMQKLYHIYLLKKYCLSCGFIFSIAYRKVVRGRFVQFFSKKETKVSFDFFPTSRSIHPKAL